MVGVGVGIYLVHGFMRFQSIVVGTLWQSRMAHIMGARREGDRGWREGDEEEEEAIL